MKKEPIFTGSCTAIVTPFKNGTADLKKMAELIDLQVAGGTAAIVVCGTTGENATQTIDEHSALVDFCVKHAAGRLKVIAGVGSNDTMTSVHLTEEAVQSGVADTGIQRPLMDSYLRCSPIQKAGAGQYLVITL